MKSKLQDLGFSETRQQHQQNHGLVSMTAIEYKESRPGDYDGARVLAAKAKNELGWEPKVDFEEGVRRYIEWYKESISLELSESGLSH